MDDDLVGRTSELAQIDALLGRVAGAHACVVVVTGEAGVGKTALLDVLLRRAEDRSFVVALGRCAASESPPYWPWPRVLRTLGGPEAQLSTETLGGRAALFAAAADRLEQSSAERPVFVAIDDLQWADESSLALGSFLVAAAAGLRIGLAFGVRDEPAEMTVPLRDTLAALPADVVRLPLSGLDVSATSELIRSVVAYEPPPAMAEELHARTGGNPLFVKECARLLAPQGGSATVVVPDRVRQVIIRRVARLQQGTYTSLAAASVADDFDLDLLAALTDMTVADVADSLAEALDARLVLLDDDGYRFAHALIRQTLFDTQPAGRRTELHRRTATALEARLDPLPPEARTALAGQAAAHWARVPVSGRPQAARLAVDAARSAASQLGYDYAASLYHWARDLGDETLDTLTELGEAQVLAGQLAQGRQTLASAAARAAVERRGETLTRAVLAAGAGVGGYEVDLRDEHQVSRLREALSLLDDDDSRLRAAALARVALIDTSLPAECRAALADNATAMAARLSDTAGEVAALAARCDILSGPDHVDDRIATTTRMVELAQRHDPVILLVARRHRLVALLEHGEIGRVDDEIAAYARTSDHLRIPLYSWIVPVWRGMRALIDGDVQCASDHCDAAEALGGAAGSANADVLAFSLRFAIDRGSGSTAALDRDVERVLGEYAGYPAADCMRAVHLVLTGRNDQARRLLHRRMTAGIESIPRDSEWLEALWNLGEVAATVAELDAVEAVHDALVPYADLWAVDGAGAACYGAVSHQLGRLSIALDRREDARQWLDAAEHAHQSAGADGLAASTAAHRRSLTPFSPHPRTSTAAAIGEFLRDGPVWHLRWHGSAATVRHSKGIHDIARLLERPRHEIHALDLMDATGSTPDRAGAGPMLDDTARRAYKKRLDELEDDLTEATAMADEARAVRLEHERELLVAELTRAYGLGGRPRTAGDPVERARKAVGMRIATAIRAISGTDPDLARHLDRSIVTGRYCSYQPETDMRWRVSP